MEIAEKGVVRAMDQEVPDEYVLEKRAVSILQTVGGPRWETASDIERKLARRAAGAELRAEDAEAAARAGFEAKACFL
jgi:hypothetical protein